MLREIFLVSFLLGLAFAANSGNQYVDNVLQSTLQQELRSAHLIPAQLPDFRVNFTTVDFTFGNITGLDRIKRKGDCTGPKNYGGEISINCTLSLDRLQAAHKTFITNSTFVTVGKVQAVITEVVVDLKIVGRPQNYLGLLKKFEVGNLDTLTPVFSNLPAYMRRDLPYLQKEYKNHVLNNLFSIFSQRYPDAFRHALAFKPMPRQ